MTSIRTGFELVRHLGPGWAWSRLSHEVELRLGLLERRCPRGVWRSWGREEATREALQWRERRGRFFFTASDREARAGRLRAFDVNGTGPGAEVAALEDGRFRYFSAHEKRLGVTPDWFLDPWTGSRMRPDVHWSRVQDFAGGDIKVVWEPSRFGWAFALVRAYWRTGDDRHAATFWRLLESWREANPPGTGPHWRCGQESTFRAMAWCLALWGFEDAPSSTPARVASLLEMLEATGRRIEAHIGYALSQRNNHGVSEAVGLFTLGTLFPWWDRAGDWKREGRRLLESLAGELVYEDGAFSQHSFNYQRVMLHDYAWALSLAAVGGRELTAATRLRIRDSARLLASWTDAVEGTVPNLGPNDGALVLPLDNTVYADFRSGTQLASLAAGGGRFWGRGPWDEAELWMLGDRVAGAGQDPIPDGARSAPVGGYFGWVCGRSRVLLHVPQFRHRPGQADLLHCDVTWRGAPLAVDAGTYSYNASGELAHGFAPARFHNTVTVDGADPMERVSRFVWLPWPSCRVSTGVGGENEGPWVQASQDGYRRLPIPVKQSRRVTLAGDDAVVVIDRMESAGEHDYRLHWLLWDWPMQADPEGSGMRFDLPGGRVRLSAGAFDAATTFEWVRAEAGGERGWHSRHYLELTPGISASWSGRGRVMTFWTVIAGEGVTWRLESESVVVQSAGGREVRIG